MIKNLEDVWIEAAVDLWIEETWTRWAIEALKKIHDWPSDDPQAVKEMKLIAGYALADLEKKQG